MTFGKSTSTLPISDTVKAAFPFLQIVSRFPFQLLNFLLLFLTTSYISIHFSVSEESYDVCPSQDSTELLSCLAPVTVIIFAPQTCHSICQLCDVSENHIKQRMFGNRINTGTRKEAPYIHILILDYLCPSCFIYINLNTLYFLLSTHTHTQRKHSL